MLVWLHIVCGYFFSETTKVSSCNRRLHGKSEILLSRPLIKSLPIPELGHRKHGSILLALSLLWGKPAALGQGYSGDYVERPT